MSRETLNMNKKTNASIMNTSIPNAQEKTCAAAAALEAAPQPPKESLWYTLLKVIVAIATALAGAFGLQSCLRP